MVNENKRVKKVDKIKFDESNLMEDVSERLYEAEKLPIDEYMEQLLIISASLLKVEDVKNSEYRCMVVHIICEHCFDHTGEYPNCNILGCLTNYILLEIIRDKNKSKFDDDNNILSPYQLKRREEREVHLEIPTMDYLHLKQTNLSEGIKKTTKGINEY